MDIVATAVVALAASCLLGRLRPWQRAGDWAADQVRFTGTWLRGGFGRQAVVVLVHVVTAPRTSWLIMRAPANETQALTPVRDPDWVANRTLEDKEGPREHQAARRRSVRPGAGPRHDQHEATEARSVVFQARGPYRPVPSASYCASMQGPWARKRARVSGQGVALSWPKQPTPPQRGRESRAGLPLISATRPYAS